jgi:hypothetical protein
LFDSVRGTNKTIHSNSTEAEESLSDVFNSFDADGFTVGNNDAVNDTGVNYVAWNWKAGTAFSNDASATSVGSADSSGSVNVNAGFSIISYVGSSGPDTIAHGLSKAPEMIMVKDRSSAQEWLVYYGYEDNYLRLDTTAAEGDNTFWNDTAPTSSVFSVGDSRPSNSGHGDSYIAYCWHSVDGYSKTGSFYIGNASADGAFNYCGFSPRWIMIKRKNAVNGWYIYDTARITHNPNGTVILANTTAAEQYETYFVIDILSNGWKARVTDGAVNTGGEYIFMAFAETPFKYSNAR